MTRQSAIVISTLLLIVLLPALPTEAARMRIAVSPFADRSGEQQTRTNTAGVGKAAMNIGSKGDLGGQVADAIITELVKLGRYEVVERVQLEKVISEQKLQLADLDDVSKASEAARLLGADFIITGSITEAASAQSGKGYLVVKKKEIMGRVVLDSRLIDIRTTRALWGTTNRGVETLSSKKIVGIGKDDLAGVQLLLGKAARHAADELVRELVPVLDQFTGGGSSLALESDATLRGSSIYLAAGGKVGVAPGDEFEIFVLGEPFTVGGKTIREQVNVGSIVITVAYPDYSSGPAPAALLTKDKMPLEGMKARRLLTAPASTAAEPVETPVAKQDVATGEPEGGEPPPLQRQRR